MSGDRLRSLQCEPSTGVKRAGAAFEHLVRVRRRRRWKRVDGSVLIVVVAVAWNLVQLRSQVLQVSYLNDSAMHEQMVRFASALFGDGRDPLTAWYPYLGLGSPQFLHYQALPALLTGLLGLVVGPNVAFGWTLYLLFALWPVSVYLLSRLMGFGGWAAACSAAMAPFLASTIHVGYEQLAYIWVGYGVWTQLWASVTLPLAWGFSWRVLHEGRRYFSAIALVAITTALHFETGYLAFLPLALWPLLAGRPIARRIGRAAIVIVGSLLTSAWVILPLIENRSWASINEALRGTPLENGYGIARETMWLISGQLLDAGRLPVVTVLAGVGIGVLCFRCKRSPAARAILALLVGCLVLSSGRTTLGSLVTIIPGSSDLFFRRFIMGVQLAALLSAGVGAEWFGRTVWETITCPRSIGSVEPTTAGSGGTLLDRASPFGFLVAGLALVLVLAPAWSQAEAVDGRNARAVDNQRIADATQGQEVNRLLATADALGPGRIYAGMPSNWGAQFRVGAVPVFKYLAREDADEVGFTLRTASLMTDPEYYFDETNPSDFALFAVRYLILPRARTPPVAAKEVASAGPYTLWTTQVRGYLRVGTLVGYYDANRGDVGARSAEVLRSPLAAHGGYLRVRWGSEAQRDDVGALPAGPPGAVLVEDDALSRGRVSAVARLRQPGVLVLSSSFDPGWHVMVDGVMRPTLMVAPALVGVALTPGTHRVEFLFRDTTNYLVLFVLALLPFVVLAVDWIRRRLPRSAPRQLSGTACGGAPWAVEERDSGASNGRESSKRAKDSGVGS